MAIRLNSVRYAKQQVEMALARLLLRLGGLRNAAHWLPSLPAIAGRKTKFRQRCDEVTRFGFDVSPYESKRPDGWHIPL